ncbi:MAG: hypothetical protein M0R51_17620 [Clostridia bacterium]|jgi:hypothetical protein|nr:hypothetical protein [Clostridia bacterium]
MKGLYSGRQIKALATKKAKITRSQTAAQAVKAIVKKYGSVADSGKYFHTGKGVWMKYSLANDSKRTGKLAGSKAQWRAQPHKLDYPGIDTKGVEKKEVKAVKPKFSLSSIKPPAKLSSRTKKTPAKVVHKAVTKRAPLPLKIPQNIPIEVDYALGQGKLKAAEELYYKCVLHANPKIGYRDERIYAAFNKYVKGKVISFYKQSREAFKNGRDLDSRVFFRYGRLAQGWAKEEKYVDAAYEKFIAPKVKKAPVVVPAPKKDYSLQNKRLRLLASMERIAPKKDPLMYYDKWNAQLKRTFKDADSYKAWKGMYLRKIENNKPLIEKLAYRKIINGENLA